MGDYTQGDDGQCRRDIRIGFSLTGLHSSQNELSSFDFTCGHGLDCANTDRIIDWQPGTAG